VLFFQGNNDASQDDALAGNENDQGEDGCDGSLYGRFENGEKFLPDARQSSGAISTTASAPVDHKKLRRLQLAVEPAARYKGFTVVLMALSFLQKSTSSFHFRGARGGRPAF